jgi:glycosyltransferase involved in cell wall biosynthesis/SAM-dependent methyltransferase
MKVGLLLPRGAGPADLARAGQWSRFTRFYLRAYAAAFEGVVLLVDEAFDPSRCSLDGVEVRRLERGLLGRRRPDAAAFADLDVVRAFQAPDLAALPDIHPPAAATFGYDYARFACLERRPLRAWRASWRAAAGARRAALLFVAAPTLEARALALAPGARLVPLANGADLSAFAPPERLGPLRRALYVGRLERQKDLPTLLRALALLPAANRPSLTLVGDGSGRRGVRRLAARLGVEVEIRGVVPHETLPGLCARHDLFILPSLEEGQSKALIEAMACALACLVSDCEGNRSMIEDGVTGWLFPRRDPAALAAALARVCALDTPELFRVRRAARAVVEERHDLRALVEREVGRVRALGRDSAGPGLDAKYHRAGAYHWRETQARDLRAFNAPLRSRYRALLSPAPRAAGRTLDAGCGDGALTAALARRARWVIGCDPSLAALELARARVPDASWVCGRLEALPFREGVFDLAVAADVLEHADDARAAAAELARVLAPQKALLASAPLARAAEPRGRFHRREFQDDGLAALLAPEFEVRAVRRSQADWLLRLYHSRPLGRAWPKRLLDLLAIAGIDLFRWPAGRAARQASVLARARWPRPSAAQTSAASASATQVAQAMNRKCG